MKALLWLALALSVPVGHAQIIERPAVIGLHAVSVHSSDGKGADGARGWNNVNPGVYLRWANGFTVGSFRNSMYRRSDYVAWTFGDDFALTVGLATGYDRVVSYGGDHSDMRCTNVCRRVQLRDVIYVIVVPSMRIPITHHWAARVSVMKAPHAPAAAHLSVEYRF